MARIVLGVALLGAPWATASAGTWDSLIFLDRTATITQTNRLCVGTGGATIACPTFAPSLTTAGDMTLGGLLTAPNANVTGDLHVGGNFYVSGSQSIDGVTFANGGIQAGGTVSATAFVGDGSGLTNVVAASSDRIISGTTQVIANNGGNIDFKTGSTLTGYYTPGGVLTSVGVSTTGTISGTTGYMHTLNVGDPGSSLLGVLNLRMGSADLHISESGFGGVWNFQVGSGDNRGIALNASDQTNQFVVANNGYVGVGTRYPSGTLHVVNGQVLIGTNLSSLPLNPSASLYIGQSDDNVGGIVLQRAGGGTTGSMFMNSGARFVVQRGVAANLLMDTTGNLTVSKTLSVNTFSPSTTLDVSGSIRMKDSGEACDAYRVGAMKYTANEFYVCRNGTAWESLTAIAQTAAGAADRITSGTTSVLAISDTGLVSITQSGINTAYFHPQLGLVTIGVSSTGIIKGTALQAYRNTSGGLLGYFRNEADMADLTIDTSPTGSSVRLMGGSVDNLILGTNGTEAIKMIGPITGGNYIIFNASGTEAMRIVSNGYVGIKASNPKSTLDVDGSMSLGGGGHRIAFGGYWDLVSDAWRNKYAGEFVTTIRMGMQNASEGGDLQFLTQSGLTPNATADANATMLKRLVIRQQGDVRIASGTYIGSVYVTPTAMLEVAGNISATNLTLNGVSLAGANDLYNLAHVSASTAAGNLFVGETTGAMAGATNATAFGIGALVDSNNSGLGNSAFGYYALGFNTTGMHNTAMGRYALASNTLGSYNTAVGRNALRYNMTGTQNTAVGSNAMFNNLTGYNNTAVGVGALNDNIAGGQNTTVGKDSLLFAANTSNTVAIGYRAGYGVTGITNVDKSVLLGSFAGYAITSSTNNILIGYNAGGGITTGGDNIVIGTNVSPYSNTGNNQLNIGNAIYGDLAMQRIGIGVTSPSVSLEVSGSLRLNNGVTSSTMDVIPFPSGGGFDIKSAGTIGFFSNSSRMVQLRPTGLLVGINLPVSNYPFTALQVSGTIRIADGGEACDANRTGAMRYNSGEFYICRNGTAWESLTSIAQAAAVNADRITSGTTYVVADGTTGLVSITQSGTNTAYFHPSLGLVTVGVSSTGPISGTNGYFSGSMALGTTTFQDFYGRMLNIYNDGPATSAATGNAGIIIQSVNRNTGITLANPESGTSNIYFRNDIATDNGALTYYTIPNKPETQLQVRVSKTTIASFYPDRLSLAGSLLATKVGIGVDTPSTSLDIGSSIRMGQEGSALGFNAYWDSTLNDWANSAANSYGALIRMGMQTTGEGGDIQFRTQTGIPNTTPNTVVPLTNRLVIRRAGDVRIGSGLFVGGIGTTPTVALHVSGTLRIADGGEACDANRAGAIKYGGGNFYFCDGTTGWKTLGEVASLQSDRITSGTTSVLAISNTGLVSITQSGVNTAYFHPSLGLVAVGVSTTGMVSATGLYVGGNSTILNVTRYDGTVGSTGGVARFTLNTSGTFVNGTGPALTFSALSDMGRIGFYADSYDGTATSSRLGSFFVQNRNVLGSYLTNFVVNSNGFVGVGTTSPTTRMDVSGSIKVSGDSSDVCDDAHVGMIRRDPATGHMQLCQ